MAGPLHEVKVLDFTMYQQGAEGTRMLADMGADILKVEPRVFGDFGRYVAVYGPDAFSTYFLSHNRGKRSITLDLKKARAREIVLELAKDADVVSHNFRPGVMEKLGLAYEDFRTIKADVIYAFATAWGTRGSRAPEPGFDIAGQAMGGMISVTGDGEYPVPAGAAIADYAGAIHLALGICAALYHREKTGEGQSLDVSLLGSTIAMQAWEITYHLITKQPSKRAGRGHAIVPTIWQVFKTKDDYLVIGGISRDRWAGLCRATGMEQIEHDPRFEGFFERQNHLDELHALFQEAFLKRTNAEWLVALQAEDMVYAPVLTYEQLATEEQALENDYIVTVDHPEKGAIQVTGMPINFSATPVAIQPTAPQLGQQSEEILLALGYSWDTISALREQEVI